jgi:hypothetical protein
MIGKAGSISSKRYCISENSANTLSVLVALGGIDYLTLVSSILNS